MSPAIHTSLAGRTITSQAINRPLACCSVDLPDSSKAKSNNDFGLGAAFVNTSTAPPRPAVPETWSGGYSNRLPVMPTQEQPEAMCAALLVLHTNTFQISAHTTRAAHVSPLKLHLSCTSGNVRRE